jgi:hypothetical protein
MSPPRFDFVHVLERSRTCCRFSLAGTPPAMRELENDHAVRWGLTTYRKSLIEPASDVFAAIVIDGLLRTTRATTSAYLPIFPPVESGRWFSISIPRRADFGYGAHASPNILKCRPDAINAEHDDCRAAQCKAVNRWTPIHVLKD